MQNNISNFIPNSQGKKRIILERDTARLMRALERELMEIIEDPMRGVQWRQRRQESYIRERNAEEWATTIYTDDTLSQGIGNPPYYPPVPVYNMPEGRNYSRAEIETILALQSSTFAQEHIDVSTIGLTTEEINQRLESAYMLHPGLLENSIIYEVDVEIITGFRRREQYSYPETTSYVGYMVGVTATEDGKNIQINHIYVYKNTELLAKLLEFLETLDVSNPHDLESAKVYLRSVTA